MSAPPPVKKLKTDVRRLDGMQRELYSLLGENTPPLAIVPEKFKSKPNWRQKATPWHWREFKNKARDDNLKLHHWVRGQQDEDEVYRFVPLNTKIQVPEWSDEEYRLFKSDDWTIAETRYLFDLCRDYDLRWVVIHDRYMWTEPSNQDTEMRDADVDGERGVGEKPVDLPETKKDGSSGGTETSGAKPKNPSEPSATNVENGHARTIEDLKERYYDVCSALIKKSNNLSPADEELLEQMKFSKEKETQRKAHLERLLSRSPAEVAEEEALVLESRRLEALADRILQERNEIMQLLDSPASNGSIAAYQSSQGIAQLHQQLLAEKSRKPKDTGVRKDERKGVAVQLMQKRLTAKEETAYGISYQDRHTPGVYLRSSKISSLKQGIAPKAHAIFGELGLPVRPVMPTLKVCSKFESLQQSITVLLDAKRVQDRLETEIKIAQQGTEPAPETTA